MFDLVSNLQLITNMNKNIQARQIAFTTKKPGKIDKHLPDITSKQRNITPHNVHAGDCGQPRHCLHIKFVKVVFEPNENLGSDQSMLLCTGSKFKRIYLC